MGYKLWYGLDERKENTVSAPSGWLAKKARLTKRERVYHESSRLQALGKGAIRLLDDVHGGVVVLFDRIPIGDHQNDGPRRPKRTHVRYVRPANGDPIYQSSTAMT